MMKRLALVFLLLAGLASAQSVIEVNATWTAPTVGSPVVQYIVQLATDGGAFADCCVSVVPSAAISLAVGHVYVARVAARDAKGRQGVWSISSSSYEADTGVPGVCGVVTWPLTQ
jgi:uncharacterized protein YdbL (DUF1318 family)